MGITSETRCCRDCGKPLSVTQRSNAKYCFGCAEERRKEVQRRHSRKYGKNHREELSQYQKARRTWLKEHGICVSCGNEDAVEGLTLCQKCREKSNESGRKYRQKKA